MFKQEATIKYVNLYTESEYSLLSSPNRLTSLIAKAKEYGYQALAITDLDNMYGALEFSNATMEPPSSPLLVMQKLFSIFSEVVASL